jgi:hypothetical protein
MGIRAGMLRARRRWVKGRDSRRAKVGSIQIEGRQLRLRVIPLDDPSREKLCGSL